MEGGGVSVACLLKAQSIKVQKRPLQCVPLNTAQHDFTEIGEERNYMLI